MKVARSVAVALEAPDPVLEDDHRPVTGNGVGGAAQHEQFGALDVDLDQGDGCEAIRKDVVEPRRRRP